MKRILLVVGSVLILGAAIFAWRPETIPGGEILVQKVSGRYTVADRVEQFGAAAQNRWQPHFEKAKVHYPPQKIVLIGLKEEKRLEVYAQDDKRVLTWIRDIPVVRASGKMGPKLREGDLQVPEGFYKIESLNPNSAFHLALRVNYPNAFDREQAEREGRDNLGGDIMIHGGAASIGCLAVGDEAAEDLFILAAQSGRENIELILSPVDFRQLPSEYSKDEFEPWVQQLHQKIAAQLRNLPAKQSSS